MTAMGCIGVWLAVALGQAESEVQGNSFVDFTNALGSGVNTSQTEWTPRLSADKRILIFGSLNRPEGLGGWDLYMAKRPGTSGPFTEVRNLGSPVNTAAAEANGILSADGTFLVIHSNRSGGQGRGDLWLVTRDPETETYGTPVNLAAVNSAAGDIQPSISTDGLTLYFASDRGGSSDDIWVSTRATLEDSFGPAMRLENLILGSQVNTFQPEWTPCISGDGLALFFSEYDEFFRPGGAGSGDMWVSMRMSDDQPFGEAVNLDQISHLPVNTANYDGAPGISRDWPSVGAELYFYRGGDIWRATWAALPLPSFEITPTACGDTPVSFEVDASASTTPDGTAITSFEWDFGDGVVETDTQPEASHTTDGPGRFLVELTATNDADWSLSTTATVCALCPSGELGGPWIAADIGEPDYPGAARLEDNSGREELAICAGGNNIFGSQDELFFVYQELVGNFRIQVRLEDVASDLTGISTGLMARGSLSDGAAYGTLGFETTSRASFLKFRLRATADRFATGAGRGEDLETPAAWMRLVRRHNELSAWTSSDGEAWELVDSALVFFPETILVGVFGVGRDRGVNVPLTFRPLESRFSSLSVESFQEFIRGDCNGDGDTAGAQDALFLLTANFIGGLEFPCPAACDVDGGGDTNGVADALELLNHNFIGGVVIEPPFPECGQATLPTDEELGCASPPPACN